MAVERVQLDVSNSSAVNEDYNRMLISDEYQMSWNSSQSLQPLTISLGQGSYRRVIFGYCLPSLIAVTAILNSIVFIVLTKSHMKSSVNVMLAALAVSDTLKGLSALPYYVYLYSIDRKHSFIPFPWCYIQKLCSGILPTMFHTISIWLTFTLAIQRYIYLCHSLRAKKLCTIQRTAHTVVGLCLCSFIMHSPRLFDSSFVKVRIDLGTEFGYVDTCVEMMQQWAMDIQHIYYPVYYWTRLIVIQIIPSIGLVVLNFVLIHVMRTANRRRRLLILQNRSSEWKRVRETNCTTLMLVVVVSIFLLVELPLGMLMLLCMLQSAFSYDLITEEYQNMLTVLFNCLVLLSYPVNFFIYVAMSKKFRREVTGLFARRLSRLDSVATIQTSREKSSSMDLVKSLFTVLAVPSGTASGSRKGSCNSSCSSNVSSIQRQRTSSLNYHQGWTNPTCECPCDYCVSKCRKPKELVNASTYSDYIIDAKHTVPVDSDKF